jgi:hypothetical protein
MIKYSTIFKKYAGNTTAASILEAAQRVITDNFLVTVGEAQ